MINIKVAVRIRPFSERELIQNDELIVEGDDKSIYVTNPKIPGKKDGDSRLKTKRFTVDFCYDAKNPHSSSQEAVYKEIGEEILNSTFGGYNSCVLAYGHSASGKTYTIMGLPDDPGLTPRICQGLFDRIDSSKSNINFQVIVSFLEIYNEKVRDLLGKEDEEPFSGNLSLRVREHPKLGPYVQDLSQHIVNNKNRLLELLILGNTRRSTAATENNNHSSRSHAVFTLRIKQTDEENFETDKSSKVHLVDLAGSLQETFNEKSYERANGVQNKTRLKEGANINKSLVTLGNVISALAESYEIPSSSSKEHSSLKTWQPFVPYRDSVLTWLLKDTLGGNSNTIMIATVSPASSCLNETVNTLRYAKRTKRILNQPIVNEDPKIKTIRELRKEIAKLKFMLLSFHKVSNLAGENSGVNNVDCMEFENFENSRCSLSLSLEETRQIKKEDDIDKDNPQRFPVEKMEESNRELRKRALPKENEGSNLEFLEAEAIEKKSINRRPQSHMLFGTQRAASLVSGTCKINDEKKSDVNGSVIVSSSHETPIFLDSLESLSSLSPDTKNLGDCELRPKNDATEPHGKIKIVNNVSKSCFAPKKKFKLCKKREFSSCENLTRSNFPKMLHKSRPDLIKGISGRSKEGLPSSSQSCTDVSNLSQSNSENSLNSSGSVDVQYSEGRSIKKTRSLDIKPTGNLSQKKLLKDEEFPTTIRKVDKRTEIVDAVTSRLYITKKKPDHRLKALQTAEKDDCDDDGELEELKLCKRARMKLFDLSRKLAMTRKFKKTVESDSQTDFCHRTVRVKEKSVITDRSGLTTFENSSTNTCYDENLKPKSTGKVIMNQVFLPPKSKYFVIECGQGVHIEMPGNLNKNDHSIQTSPEKEKTYKDMNTSPVKFIVCADDSFSDDSLDLEEKGKVNSEVFLQSDTVIDPKLGKVENLGGSKQKLDNLQGDGKILIHQKNSSKENLCPEGLCECLAVLSENLNSKSSAKDSRESPNPLSIFARSPEYNSNCLTSLSSENLSLPLRKDENLSSENSFTSGESTDAGSVSETSSEDFVFYTGSKDQSKGRIPSDRELYTITENSEQSDLSDVFSPSQNECSARSILETGESFSKPINTNLNDAFDRTGNKTWKSLENPFIKEGGSAYQVFAQNIQGNAQITSFKKIPSKVEMLNYKNLEDISANPEVVPNLNSNYSKAFLSTAAKIQTDFNHKDVKSQSVSSRFKKTNWSDLSMNPQKQYLNFNILNSSKQSQFVVDTHLLKDFSKKDQSTETVFTSEDSITFIFMGPAKPKTSVLMEVIKRSLNKETFKETSNPQRSKSKGVQCSNKLIRSISVDTALTALSSIAKQHPLDIPRTISLDALTREEISEVVEQERHSVLKEESCHCNESRCECHADSRHFKKEPLKYSVSTATTRDQHTETENRELDIAFGKPKVENLWSDKSIDQNSIKYFDKSRDTGATNSEEIEESNTSNLFRTSNNGPSEIDSSENQSLGNSSSDNFPNAQSSSQTRRVRFSKPETRSLEDLSDIISKEKDFSQANDTFGTFLKEATSLLKNLNYFSAQQKLFSNEIIKRLKELQMEQSKERRNEAFRVSSKRFQKNLPSSDCVTKSANSNKSCQLQKENLQNLTWPRRRSTMSKPPKSIRYTPSPKPPRSPLSSIFNSFHSNPYLECSRNNSQSGRTTPGSTIWNASNLSTTFSNSYVGQDHSRPSSLRSIYSNRSSSSPPVSFSKPMVPEENLESLLDIRAELEESCRSLKIAAEQDKLRQESSENKISVGRWTNRIVEKTYVEIENEEKEEEESETEIEKHELIVTKEVMKRRRTNDCIYGCNCSRSHKKSCTCFFSKAFRSTFELDTFGPGSKHCLRFCMFCRKKDSELYCSSPTLNSECQNELCRLNYYGYCPCSPVKLPYVSYSPRAYMQHLLTLRRRIVNATKRNNF